MHLHRNDEDFEWTTLEGEDIVKPAREVFGKLSEVLGLGLELLRERKAQLNKEKTDPFDMSFRKPKK
jgi:hypothetical protein